MTDPIDYSRPVGWWCPVCCNTDHVCSIGPDGRERIRFCIQSARTGFCFRRAIPRYLPIPEGQRPPAASEVEDAEVVTWATDFGLNVWGTADWNFFRLRWDTGPAPDINYIVTGATE